MQQKKYRYILWDLDGTIINSYPGVSRCVQYALEPYGITIQDEVTLRRFIGPPLRESFPAVAHLPEKYIEEAVARYRERYIPVGVFECELFPDIEEVLEAFHQAGYIQVLASSKPEAQCRQILEKFGLDCLFNEVVGASLDGRIDTKIEVLNEVFRRLMIADPDFKKAEAVLIGDTRYDVMGATEAGIDCVGVSYGFGTRQDLLSHGAIKVYESAKALITGFLYKEKEKNMLEKGIRGEQKVEVVYENTATAVGSGVLKVFATPCMLALMEKTACDSVGSYLEEGWGTVGTEVNIKHVAATPIGMTVRCESELIEVDGRRLVFTVKAYDDAGLIGEGTHERFVVNNEKFQNKSDAKLAK